MYNNYPYNYFWLLEKKIKDKWYKNLPKKCRYCDYLKICRRPRSEGWKCYNGCLIINHQKKYGYRK